MSSFSNLGFVNNVSEKSQNISFLLILVDEKLNTAPEKCLLKKTEP
jgi:hypothetical protein